MLWVLWAECDHITMLSGSVGVLFEAVVIKAILWAVPAVVGLSVLKRRRVSVLPLLGSTFPWLACIILLCIETAILYTIHLARGLSGTQVLFDPVSIITLFSAGIIEELSFRGFFFNTHLQLLGFWPAALINSLLFVLFHFPNILFIGNISVLISFRSLFIFVMGIALCRIFYKWKNITLNMVFHSTWNILAYFLCLAW